MRHGNYLTHITVPIAHCRPFHLADERETRLRLKASTPGIGPGLSAATTPEIDCNQIQKHASPPKYFRGPHFRSRPPRQRLAARVMAAFAGTVFFGYMAHCCGRIGGSQLGRALISLANLGFSEWVALVSAFVASVSFLLSRAAVRRQETMQLESFRFQRDNALISWANAAIDAIADSQRHCRDIKNGLIHDQPERLAASELRKRLSVLLDSGRLFFPNQANLGDDEVAPSEIAYDGEAHDAITALYGVYRIISDLGREGGLAPANAVYSIVAHRRRFVSEVFRSVDPLRRNASFTALANGTKLRLGAS